MINSKPIHSNVHDQLETRKALQQVEMARANLDERTEDLEDITGMITDHVFESPVAGSDPPDPEYDTRFYKKTELDAGQLDNRYFTEDEHLAASAGAGDAGKPIKLDAAGHVDATMVNDGDVDHTAIQNIGSNTHAQIDTHLAASNPHTGSASTDHKAAHVGAGSDKIRDATAAQDGLATAAQITKLDGIEAGADALPVVDTTELVKGSVDATKKVRIEADGLTTATTRVLTMPDSDITPDHNTASRPPNGAAGGDITGTYPNPTVAADAVTYAKMQNVSATDRFLGRDTAGVGDVEEIAPAAARTILNVADGADVTGDNVPRDHKDSHDPGGADGLDVATPTDIGTANAEGNGTAFVRDNHVHAIPAKWRTRSFLIEVPAPPDDDEFIVHWFPNAATLTQVRVHVKAATSVTFDLTERGYDTPDAGGTDITAAAITATTTPTDVTMNNTNMAANTVLVYHSSAVVGAPGKVWIFGKYTID